MDRLHRRALVFLVREYLRDLGYSSWSPPRRSEAMESSANPAPYSTGAGLCSCRGERQRIRPGAHLVLVVLGSPTPLGALWLHRGVRYLSSLSSCRLPGVVSCQLVRLCLICSTERIGVGYICLRLEPRKRRIQGNPSCS